MKTLLAFKNVNAPKKAKRSWADIKQKEDEKDFKSLKEDRRTAKHQTEDLQQEKNVNLFIKIV